MERLTRSKKEKLKAHFSPRSPEDHPAGNNSPTLDESNWKLIADVHGYLAKKATPTQAVHARDDNGQMIGVDAEKVEKIGTRNSRETLRHVREKAKQRKLETLYADIENMLANARMR